MDERANPDRAAGTNRGAVGFERAVLLRVALDFAEYIEHTVVPEGGESPLRDVDAVVEDPPADPNTHQPPDHVLERGAVEGVDVLQCRHLPQALVQPEVRVVDGADGGLQRGSCPVRRWSNRLSRSTDRGISKQGEPSRPTPSRILPSSGIIAFVASRQLSQVRPPAV